MIIGVPIPNNYFAPWGFVKSIVQVNYVVISAEGAIIAHNRNVIFDRAKELDEDLMFIDSDTVFSPHDVKKIEEHIKEYDMITGVYPIGVPPYHTTLYKTKNWKDFINIKPKAGINEIDACGGGCLGISKKIIRALPKEPFPMADDIGEDIAFCKVVKEHGFRIWYDSSIRFGHIRNMTRYYE